MSICPVCEVDHRTTRANLSHGIIRLIEHARERFGSEYPISGDNIARQRAGISGTSLLQSTDWQAMEDST